jgi:protein-S-isoprenylcysteine O-methyltransferase Ste14
VRGLQGQLQAHGAPALIAFSFLLIAWIVGEASMTFDDRPAPGALALPTGLVVLASQVLAVATPGAGAWRGAWCGAWWGAAMMAAGIVLRLTAIAALGPAFASALESPGLITTGPYRFARHPSELGLLLIVFGGAWLVGSGWALIASVIIVPLVVIRCRREDLALASLPGYSAWRDRVAWFCPRGSPMR